MPLNRTCLNRREMLRGIGIGAVGAAFGRGLPGKARADEQSTAPQQPGDKLFAKRTEPVNVSLLKGNDRRDIIYEALKKIEDEIVTDIGRKKVLIKPNFVSTDKRLASTPADAIRAILDFLKPHVKQQILIGESTASQAGTFTGYKNFGYLPLQREYNVKLIDLNQQAWQYRYVIGKGNRPTPIRIISTLMDPDLYVISAAKMKTHDRVLTTLSLKNVLLASPLNDYKKNDKWLTHSTATFSREAVLHFNMFHLAQHVYPDLGVIDGFVGMEGNGPVGGEPVDTRVALASTDPLALDMLATKLMGFDPTQILYFNSFAEAGMGQGDMSKVKVLGTPAEKCQFHFKPSKHMIEPYNLG